MNNKFDRLVMVSNRLPLALKEQAGAWQAVAGEGGLVTALTPLLQQRGGVWVGWPGLPTAEGQASVIQTYAHHVGYELVGVPLTDAEVQGYYYGFANEILWPLFHGFETRCNFNPGYWQAYVDANRKFATAAASVAARHDFIWVHDYQLMLVGGLLRAQGLGQRLGFFLHIPFPAPEVFFKLPWRADILRGLLAYDLVGFQTLRDRRNFVACLQELDVPGLRIAGRGDVVSIKLGEQTLRVGAFPISIDYAAVNAEADSAPIAQAASDIRKRFAGCRILLGMDRLDYTKGVLERLEALRLILTRHPALRDHLCLVQVTVPSREHVPEYQQLRAEIEHRVSEVNGEFTSPGGVAPVQYLHQSLPRTEVYAWLRAADVALVTPLRDGMNLVAKEYCACQVGNDGVLVLSEFAGAAAQLGRHALLVNPYGIEATADTLVQALSMPVRQRRSRMRRLRAQIAEHDIFRWLDSLLHAALDRKLPDGAAATEALPQVDLSLDA